MSTVGLGVAVALLAAVAIAGEASAAPGDASARGVVIALDGSAGGVPITAHATVGTADAPAGGGSDAHSAIAVELTGAVGVIAAGTADSVTASRAADLSTAATAVSAVSIGVLGVTALSVGTAAASTDCPQTGTLTADTTLTGLELFGSPTTLAAGTPGVLASAAVTVPGLTDPTLTVAVTRVQTVAGAAATAAAVQATLSLTATVAGVPARTQLGTVTLASASCDRPAAAPTATAVTPDSGPATGGQTVTVTGTGFVSGATTVTVGGSAAADVAVAAGGTSLTAVSPAGTAGATQLVVSTAAGTSAPLPYSYLADPGTGTDPGASTGGTTPTLTSLTPGQGPPAGGQTLVITGTGFRSDVTTVTIGGTPAVSVAVVDGDTLVVRTPPGAAGRTSVVVTVAGIASTPLPYAYVAGATVPAAPSAGSLDPAGGPIGGGTAVTGTGTNFVSGQTSVIVCGATLLPAHVQVAATRRSLSFTTPACAAGPADVVVVTPGGVTAAVPFTYGDSASGVSSDSGSGATAGILPATGTDPGGLGLLGVVLLVTGAVLTGAARRRSVSPASASTLSSEPQGLEWTSVAVPGLPRR